jgi:hypothetical protein
MTNEEIQAIVRYADGTCSTIWQLPAIALLENVDQIRKITFYNEAKLKVQTKFNGIPSVLTNQDYLTHVGEVAQFIVYNW